jgi:hypothetical protein
MEICMNKHHKLPLIIQLDSIQHWTWHQVIAQYTNTLWRQSDVLGIYINNYIYRTQSHVIEMYIRHNPMLLRCILDTIPCYGDVYKTQSHAMEMYTNKYKT